MTHNNNIRRRAAFTLIEMLLGLLIYSVIAVCLYSVFRTGIQLDAQSQSANRSLEELRLAIEQIGGDLENARYYNFVTSYPDALSFQGERHRFRLLLGSEAGLKVVSYYLDKPDFGSIVTTVVNRDTKMPSQITTQHKKDANIRFLIREETGLVDFLANNTKNVSKEVVLTALAIDGMSVSYAGETENKELSDAWNNRFLPSRVHVSLTIPGKKDMPSVAMTREFYLPTGI